MEPAHLSAPGTLDRRSDGCRGARGGRHRHGGIASAAELHQHEPLDAYFSVDSCIRHVDAPAAAARRPYIKCQQLTTAASESRGQVRPRPQRPAPRRLLRSPPPTLLWQGACPQALFLAPPLRPTAQVPTSIHWSAVHSGCGFFLSLEGIFTHSLHVI